jgi:serine protease Do
VSDLSAAQKRELKVEAGVLVEAAEGRAASGRHPPGRPDPADEQCRSDLGRPVQRPGRQARREKPVALLVRRENASQYLVIKPRQ